MAQEGYGVSQGEFIPTVQNLFLVKDWKNYESHCNIFAVAML